MSKGAPRKAFGRHLRRTYRRWGIFVLREPVRGVMPSGVRDYRKRQSGATWKAELKNASPSGVSTAA